MGWACAEIETTDLGDERRKQPSIVLVERLAHDQWGTPNMNPLKKCKFTCLIFHRGRDTCVGLSLGVENGNVLGASVEVMKPGIVSMRLTGI